VSHGAIYNLVNGRTGRLYGTTIGKLRDWYLRQWASGGDGLTPDVAAYLVEQVLATVPPGERSGAALELVQALEGIYARRGRRGSARYATDTGTAVQSDTPRRSATATLEPISPTGYTDLKPEMYFDGTEASISGNSMIRESSGD
jgi:hypothetical protein